MAVRSSGSLTPPAGGSSAAGGGNVLSLLSGDPPAATGAGEPGQDRSFARDLNLDQIVATVAGDREERDLISRVLYTPLHDVGAVRRTRNCPIRCNDSPTA
jgi:hypothetical protein